MVSPRSSIGEISSKISSRPLRVARSVRPAASPSATRCFQISLPTSQSKLSVCSASRSGTVRVSLILANESRDALRPFFAEPRFFDEPVVDAVRAAAKEIPSVWARRPDTVGSGSLPEFPTEDPPRRYTRGAPAVHNMTAWGRGAQRTIIGLDGCARKLFLDLIRALRYKPVSAPRRSRPAGVRCGATPPRRAPARPRGQSWRRPGVRSRACMPRR